MTITDSGKRALMHVLVYSMNYAPELTGIGRYSGELVEALAASGIRCTVVTTPPHYPQWRVTPPYINGYRREQTAFINVLRCPVYIARRVRGLARLMVPASFALSSAPAVIWSIIRHRPDVVLCVEPTLFAAPAAIAAARLAGSRTVLHVQDLEIDAALEVGHLKRHGIVERIARAFDLVVLRRFDSIVTISEGMRKGLIAKGLPPRRVSIIRNWVDTSAIYPTGDRSYRHRLGIAEDAFLILYAGSVGAKQGIDLLCEAAASIDPDSGLVLAVVGEGPAKEALVERFGLHPHIRFHGLQPEQGLNGMLNAADLHVIPQLMGATDFALPSKLGGILASGQPLLVLGHPDQELSRFVGEVATVVEPVDAATVTATLLRLATRGTSASNDSRVALAGELSKTQAVDSFIGLFKRMLAAGSGRSHTDAEGETK